MAHRHQGCTVSLNMIKLHQIKKYIENRKLWKLWKTMQCYGKTIINPWVHSLIQIQNEMFVLWKSVRFFVCNQNYKPKSTNKQTGSKSFKSRKKIRVKVPWGSEELDISKAFTCKVYIIYVLSWAHVCLALTHCVGLWGYLSITKSQVNKQDIIFYHDCNPLKGFLLSSWLCGEMSDVAMLREVIKTLGVVWCETFFA